MIPHQQHAIVILLINFSAVIIIPSNCKNQMNHSSVMLHNNLAIQYNSHLSPAFSLTHNQFLRTHSFPPIQTQVP